MVPHRREEPASYRPTANARKHGPLRSRTGRQIRDFSRATPSFRHAPGDTLLTLIDARFSSRSPRSNLATPTRNTLVSATGPEQFFTLTERATPYNKGAATSWASHHPR